MRISRLKLVFSPGRNELVRIMTDRERTACIGLLLKINLGVDKDGNVYRGQEKVPENIVAYFQSDIPGEHRLYLNNTENRHLRRYHRQIRRESESIPD